MKRIMIVPENLSLLNLRAAYSHGVLDRVWSDAKDRKVEGNIKLKGGENHRGKGEKGTGGISYNTGGRPLCQSASSSDLSVSPPIKSLYLYRNSRSLAAI
jgi:hypothetical protein